MIINSIAKHSINYYLRVLLLQKIPCLIINRPGLSYNAIVMLLVGDHVLVLISSW